MKKLLLIGALIVPGAALAQPAIPPECQPSLSAVAQAAMQDQQMRLSDAAAAAQRESAFIAQIADLRKQVADLQAKADADKPKAPEPAKKP